MNIKALVLMDELNKLKLAELARVQKIAADQQQLSNQINRLYNQSLQNQLHNSPGYNPNLLAQQQQYSGRSYSNQYCGQYSGMAYGSMLNSLGL